MAVSALTDAFVYGGDKDFTTDTNDVKIDASAAELDSTTFGSGGWTEKVGGLKSGSLDVKGFWASGTGQVDPTAWTALGVADTVFTVGPIETEGQPAYFAQMVESHYEVFGPVGELNPFSLQAATSTDIAGIIRGRLMKAKGTVAATGVLGSVVQVGAASSTQYLYVAFHVFTAGTTITVQVQSDNAVGFPSATTVATIGPLTTTGGTFMTRVAGPITDDYYRLNISAITGSFSVAAALGVQ